MTSSCQICMKIARIKCFWVILSFFVSGMKLYWGMIYMPTPVLAGASQAGIRGGSFEAMKIEKVRLADACGLPHQPAS